MLVCFALAGCAKQYSAAYQDVDAEDKWDESTGFTLGYSYEKPPLYIVRDDKLYLKIRENRVKWYLHTVVEYPPWNRTETLRFLDEHQELKKYIALDWNDWLPKGFGDECKPGRPVAY